jgi:histidinol-phosphate aminotransferase
MEDTAMDLASPGLSRRSFARLLGLVGAGLGSGLATGTLAPREARAQAPAGAPAPVRMNPEELLRLSANENPYGPCPAAFTALREAASRSFRYPDAELDGLTEAVAQSHGLPPEQVVLGAGSSEILKLAAAAFTAPDRAVVVAEPTFEAIVFYARATGAPVVKVPLTADHRHDLAKMAAVPKAGIVYLCNPNNPTASLTPKGEVRAFLKALPPTTAVLVDEAYFHYVESPDYESVLPLLGEHPNLIVARTFSKIHGMAGLRCGYGVAQKETALRLRLHQAFDSLSLPALVAARASLGDPAHLERSRQLNREVRGRVCSALDGMGLRYIPSSANFMMIDLGREMEPVRAALRARKVDAGRRFPAMPHHLRVTIGTGDEMDRFLAAFKQVMA